MSVMRSKDGTHLTVDCSCGCDNGIKIKITRHDEDNYALLSYTSGNFYREQNERVYRVIGKRLKKIWRILRGKDYCYSKICMSHEDLKEFQAYINEIE